MRGLKANEKSIGCLAIVEEKTTVPLFLDESRIYRRYMYRILGSVVAKRTEANGEVNHIPIALNRAILLMVDRPSNKLGITRVQENFNRNYEKQVFMFSFWRVSFMS